MDDKLLMSAPWLNIFSFITEIHSDIKKYCFISKYFHSILTEYLKTRISSQYNRLVEYEPLPFSASFWNNFENHFPIWDLKLSPRDIFSMHLCKSLERSDEDEDRTDQILYHLAKKKTFSEGHFLEEKKNDYHESLCHFIWHNVNDIRFYVFIEIRNYRNVFPVDGHSFRKLMADLFETHDPISLIRLSFLLNIRHFLHISKSDPTGRLEKRLVNLLDYHMLPEIAILNMLISFNIFYSIFGGIFIGIICFFGSNILNLFDASAMHEKLIHALHFGGVFLILAYSVAYLYFYMNPISALSYLLWLDKRAASDVQFGR